MVGASVGSVILPVEKRKDVMGRYRTQSLFLETNNTSEDPMFTLYSSVDKKKDGKTYISLRQMYLDFEDITEYEFVMTIFGEWNHWLKLTRNALIGREIREWRKELEIKLRSKAIKEIAKESDKGGASGISAAKWLAEGRWKSADRGKGRPSKKGNESEEDIHARISAETKEDLERITGKTTH